ncbi:MAG: hypothetical protein ACQCN5_00500 [Candidatus Bathyarchaeia archaeon]
MDFLKKLGSHLTAPKADANLVLSEQFVVIGDCLEGTLTVLPHETIDADEVRCELDCIETARVMRTDYDPAAKRMVTRMVTETRKLYEVNPVCCPSTQLVNGVSRSFKLSVNIPIGSRPTFSSVNDNVEWQIKGVVAVHGRPDLTTDTIKLMVIPESQRPQNQAPKIRLVNCEYCESAMPETILACPNCGARRKAV